LHGIGPGTFRFYWYQHTTHAEYIQNAHSLWFETLAETGIVGWLLLTGFFALTVLGGCVTALRATGQQRTLIATATAGLMAFCASASFDWVWQIGVMLGLGAVVALVLIAVPLSATVAVRASQRQVDLGDLRQALKDADTAHALEPGAASPELQRALVLEKSNDIPGAAAAISAAIARERTDYVLWLEASRIATESNRPRLALADFRRAQKLYPTSSFFTG